MRNKGFIIKHWFFQGLRVIPCHLSHIHLKKVFLNAQIIYHDNLLTSKLRFQFSMLYRKDLSKSNVT